MHKKLNYKKSENISVDWNRNNVNEICFLYCSFASFAQKHFYLAICLKLNITHTVKSLRYNIVLF